MVIDRSMPNRHRWIAAAAAPLRYGFKGPIDGDQFYHVHIEGGLMIDIVCTEAHLVP
jgi:hypothetical protein